jgi:hypothetical protein
MKVLFRTERTPARSKDMGHGPPQEGVAWFDLVLHEGPPDEKTWDGCGQTIAYWRGQFARSRNPHPWTIDPAGIQGVAPAVIPDEVLRELPDDARISFSWNFVRARDAESESRAGA